MLCSNCQLKFVIGFHFQSIQCCKCNWLSTFNRHVIQAAANLYKFKLLIYLILQFFSLSIALFYFLIFSSFRMSWFSGLGFLIILLILCLASTIKVMDGMFELSVQFSLSPVKAYNTSTKKFNKREDVYIRERERENFLMGFFFFEGTEKGRRK